MNDDDKKPLVPEDGVDESKPDQEADEIKVEVKKGDTSGDEADFDSDDAPDDIDITAALKENKAEDKDLKGTEADSSDAESSELHEEVPEEESEIDKELDRIEGIESTSTAAPEPEVTDEAETVDADVTSPVDMEEDDKADEATSEKPKEVVASAAVASALKHQEAKQKKAKSSAGLLAALLAVLVLVAGVGAGYFYFKWNDTRDQLTSIESQLSSEKTKNSSLTSQITELNAEEKDMVDDAAYVVIPELGVRYKAFEATTNVVFGYTPLTTDLAADAVAVSTEELVKLSVGTGNAVTYPCGFTGNVPTIARYATDIKIGDSTASKLGKQIGNAYFVYTAPTGNCAPTDIAAQTARNAAAKAVYDALEAIPEQGASQTTAGTSATQPENN